MKARAFTQRLLCVVAVLFVSLGVVRADTIYVDRNGNADYGNIQAAVAAAQSGDTIILKPGAYTGAAARDLVLAGKVLTLQSSDPTDPETVATTVIDCQVKDGLGHRFIEITPKTGAGLTLAGLKIINASGAFAGGVILCEDASLNLINCTFTDNSAQWWAGAVYCEDSNVVIEGCTFTNNVSTAMHGGALFCQNSTLDLTGSTFRKNTGNAVKFFDSAVTISDCMFDNNVGREGGAIYGNAALDSDAVTYLDLVDCTFINNTCETSGGALHNYGLETTIASCTFTANTATQSGGALYNHRSSPVITNCVFDDNMAGGFGGAVANYNQSLPEIRCATFVGNEAATGGAISSRRDSDPLISHSIFWDNKADKGPSLYLARDTLSTVYTAKGTVAYCNLEGGQSSIHVDPGCVLVWGAGNLDANPLFTGQPFGDYHLSSDSPCIDAGNPTDPPAADATDRDGLTRLFAKAADLGAYEYQGLGPVYRFWSPSQSRHFFTISGAERDRVIERYPEIWTFEGIAYYAFYQNTEAGLVPVYRFWSPVSGSHLWTTSKSERDKLIRDAPDVWAYEGVAFHAYDAGKPPLGTSPVYRIWSAKLGYHFYTMDEGEKNKLITEYPNVWVLEGIAFYTYSTPYKPKIATYYFTGDAEDASYTMVLTAYLDGKEAEIDLPEVRLTTTEARMQMTTDFTNQTVTLDAFRLESELIEHRATIGQRGSTALSIPFSMSARATFKALSPRGPFAIDSATGTFADFRDAPESLPAENETYTHSGQVTLDGRTASFDFTAEAAQFDLESSGTFGSLSLLSEGVSASLPQTFQWQRPEGRDLLVETMVDGRLIQLFVTYTYVGTQGVWQGKISQ